MRTKLLRWSALLVIVVCTSWQNTANAQLLLNEDFDYTVGSFLTANGWTAHSGSGTRPIAVVSPSLSVAGYIGSGVGYSAALDTTGEDVNHVFTAQTSGVIFTSLMVKVNGNSTAGHFFHFGQTTIGTNFFNRLWVNAGGTGLGLGIGTSAPTAYVTITPGNTYLIVMKFDYTTKQNQLLVLDTFPTSEPAVYQQSIIETASFTNIGSVALRQFNTTEKIIVDGIRIGNTWADVVTSSVVVPDVTPPVVDTAWATSLSTVKVKFNEAVDNITAETIGNYSGLAGVGTAVLNTTMDTVTLSLSTPLLDNIADTVCIANVEDTAGNVMATSQCFRLIFSLGDIIPPVVDTAWAENLSTVKVVFNEAMDEVTAETIGNYTGLAGIGTATLNTTMDTVTLALSTPLLLGIADTVCVANVEDTAGNPLATSDCFRVIYGVLDITAPTVITAWPADLATVKVKFSEAMDETTAEIVANYTGLAGIGTATLNTTLDTVTLALSTHLISGIADTLYVQTVQDTAGNPMATQQMFVLMLDTATTAKKLVITEIMYNPAESGTDSTEFIEIYNNDLVPVDMMNYTLKYGSSTFTFPTSTILNNGAYLLIAPKAVPATNFYGVSFIQGSTGGIGNGGATITLYSPSGLLVDSVVYDDVAPWPAEANQGGYSLSFCDPNLDNNIVTNWTLGHNFYGIVNSLSVFADPGQGCTSAVDTTAPIATSAWAVDFSTVKVRFNEAVESVSGENTANYTGLGALSNVVLNTNGDTATLTLATPLVSGVGEILSVTGISDLNTNTMTLVYDFPIMLDTSSTIYNLVITEIMYNSPESGLDSLEFIEIYNNDVVAVDLLNYKISYGTVNKVFNTSFTLNPGEYAIVTPNKAAADAFYGFNSIQGPTNGISNSGTFVKLNSPSGLLIDSLSYLPTAPWPTQANGGGPSLTLCDPSTDNTDAANWSASTRLVGVIATINVYADPDTTCATTGIEVVDAEMISVYPNPASNNINITGIENAATVEVFNNMGMLMLSYNQEGKSVITLDAANLPDGLYYINVRMNDGNVITKPVVIIK